MKKLLLIGFFLIFSVTACDGWSYTVPTFPAPPPSITPAIYSPTPKIVTITSTPELPTINPTETVTTVPTTEIVPTFTESLTSIPFQNLSVDILGCNTSIDIIHALGEVTNAFVLLKNNSGEAIVDLCATLYALDEGRIHPNKTICVALLEQNQQVTLKLTVDSTYKKDTLIQVELKSGENLLSRVDNPSCTDIGLFAPDPDLLLTPVPIS